MSVESDRLLWLLILFIMTSTIQSNKFIKCNEEINGTTMLQNNNHTYLFQADDQSKTIIINTCKSTYNPKIYLYDQDNIQIAYNESSIICPQSQSVPTYGPLKQENYSIVVTGYKNHYGDYSMQIYCVQPNCM